jgi:hypothetical protein
MLDQPIFLAGRGKGMPDKYTPITAKGFTEFFQRAAMRSGYGQSVGFSSLSPQTAVDASPALTRFFDQSGLDDRINRLCLEMEPLDRELQAAIINKDRYKKNTAKQRTRRNAEKKAYEEGWEAEKSALTPKDLQQRKELLVDLGSFMRRIHEYFSENVVQDIQVLEAAELFDIRDPDSPSNGGKITIDLHVPHVLAYDKGDFLSSVKLLFKCLGQKTLLSRQKVNMEPNLRCQLVNSTQINEKDCGVDGEAQDVTEIDQDNALSLGRPHTVGHFVSWPIDIDEIPASYKQYLISESSAMDGIPVSYK